MSTENIQAIDTLYRTAAQGDMNTALQMLDPAVVVYEQESLPYGGAYHGHKGYQQLFTNIMEIWGDFKFTQKQLLDAGEYVVAIVQLQGRAKSTNKMLNMDMYELWKMRDGKGIECRSIVYDTAKMLELLK